MKLDDRCQPIELILSDVDGVLTDGSLIFNNDGIETKIFNVRDGLGIRLWQKCGFRFGLLTARTSHVVQVRAAELSIDIVRQGFEQKLPAAKEVAQSLNLNLDQVCYIGDDLTDLPVIREVGLGVTVADGVAEVQKAAAHVTKAYGGRGAIRELIETMLKAKQRWEDIVARY